METKVVLVSVVAAAVGVLLCCGTYFDQRDLFISISAVVLIIYFIYWTDMIWYAVLVAVPYDTLYRYIRYDPRALLDSAVIGAILIYLTYWAYMMWYAVLVAGADVILYRYIHDDPRALLLSAVIGAILIYLTYWAYMKWYAVIAAVADATFFRYIRYDPRALLLKYLFYWSYMMWYAVLVAVADVIIYRYVHYDPRAFLLSAVIGAILVYLTYKAYMKWYDVLVAVNDVFLYRYVHYDPRDLPLSVVIGAIPSYLTYKAYMMWYAVLVAVAVNILYRYIHDDPRVLLLSAVIGAILIYLTYRAYMKWLTNRMVQQQHLHTRSRDINYCSRAVERTESLPKYISSHVVTSAKTDDIFTNVTNVYNANKKQEKKEQARDLDRSGQQQEYNKRTMSCKVEKYEDIFVGMKERNRKLLLTGKPGIDINDCSRALKSSVQERTESLPNKMPSHDVTSAKTDDIFTNLTVYYANKKQEKKEQARDLDRSGQQQEYTKRTMSCKVERYEDIFIDMQGENPKLLLTGKPGIGKTMFCDKIIRDWSMNRLFQNENTPNIQFAYLLKFRQLSKQGDKEMSLQELLNCSPLLDHNSVINDSLLEHLIQNPSKVLIILDGFDECSEQHRKQIASHFEKKYQNAPYQKMPIPVLFSKLIKGKLLRSSVVLVSSRPGKAEELGKIKFDRYVEISGFSPEQVTEYVDKYFSEPEKEQTKKAVREHVEKNENLISFCHIPLFSFLLCWCLEWQISHSEITENLPAKITDLYDEIVKVLVQKLHANLKYSEMSTYAKKEIAEQTLDQLAKLAANLLKESKYIFDEDDMKKLSLTEDDIENLKKSGILHCVPGIRISPFETKAEFSFTHLTLQEFLAASLFVKNGEIPEKEEASGRTFVFMSGLLPRKIYGEQLMNKLIQQITPKYNRDRVNKLLMLQCLYEYGEKELTTQTINNLYDKYCDSDGDIRFHGVTDADMKYLSYLLDIIRSLKEQHPQSSSDYTLRISLSPLTSFGVGVVCRSLARDSFITALELTKCSLDDKCVGKITDSLVNTGITHLDLGGNNITDEGVKSICSVLTQTKITRLDLGRNNITDEGAESICRVIIQDDCQVEYLYIFHNEKITAKCMKHLGKLVKKHKPGVLVYFEPMKQSRKIAATEKEENRLEEEKHDTESTSQHDHHSLAGSAASSRMKTLTISYEQNEAIIEVTQEGGRCDISMYGALLEFPPNTVKSSTQVVCKVCSGKSIPSPEADPMETLVSHVVQLGPSVELQQPVIVTMLHAGPGKNSGYETIVKAFNDEEGIWKEIEEFKDTSHIPKNYKPGNVIQVKISKLTSLAVISRLVTDTFEVTPTGCVVTSSVCNDVKVTFPEGAVDKTITGSMKVVLLPEMIFLFSGFKGIEFLKPVTIKFPHGGSTDDFPGRLRVMSQKGAVHPGESWNEVKGNVKLEKKKEGFLELHVQHFCRLTVSNSDGPDPEWNRSPQHVFLGAFKDNNDPLKLTIACAPIFVYFESELIGLGYERLAVSTAAEMRPQDKAYVQLKDGLDIQTDENVYVKFIEGESYRKELVYGINEQIHTTSNILYLCFYPTMEYIEDKRIDRLAIDRRRLYPTVENMDIDPPEEGMDIDHEPLMDENHNRFVAPTRLDRHIPANQRPQCINTVYRMTSNPRGIAYIININRFSINPLHKMHGRLVEFLGSDLDVNSLRRLFSDLHFDVQCSADLNQNDLEAGLQRLSAFDFSFFDCLVVFIMSHGKENYIYASDGEDVSLKDIFDMFKNSRCPTLQGKPKLFFIQACRGTVANSGEVNSDHSGEQAQIAWPGLNDRSHPEYCDNLYGYSCYEGQLSHGWPDQGSVYVQSLVAVFREHSCKEPLLNLLTMVNNRVGGFELNQIPCTNYTLRKLLYFYPGLFENP